MRTRSSQLFRIMDGVGFAHYEVGEVRLRMGDLGAAADAFDRAYEHGHDALPGLALPPARPGGPRRSRQVHRTGTCDRRQRWRAVRSGQAGALSAAHASRSRWRMVISRPRGRQSTELEALATQFERPAFVGAALTARGAVELAGGDNTQAAAHPRPGMAAVAGDRAALRERQGRVLYGQALLASGDVAQRTGTFGRHGRSSSGSAPRGMSRPWPHCWATSRRPNARSCACRRRSCSPTS